MAILPFLRREIPIILDDAVDPKFGTGAVKVTPAHDANDFQIGRRHGLAEIVVMDEGGIMNDAAGDFRGLDRFEARERIVAALRDSGYLDRVEPHHHAVGHCSRCNTIIEPYLSWQWFVKMAPLAAPGWTPPMTLLETRTEMWICLDVPGMTRDAIQIRVSRGMLEVSGERRPPRFDGEARRLYDESPRGQFRRVIPLPPHTAVEHIEARLREGTLEIRIPRISAPEAEVRTITVN